MTAPAEQYMPAEDDPLRSVEYVAKVLEFTEGTIRRWLKDGKLRGLKVMGEWRIPHSELVRFVNEEYGDTA